MEGFKKGDIVKLKSGSPEMTIYLIDSSGTIYVTWFSENKFYRDKVNQYIITKV